jgi:hypothetical protein
MVVAVIGAVDVIVAVHRNGNDTVGVIGPLDDQGWSHRRANMRNSIAGWYTSSF